jgi:hypothetical protein
MRVMGKVERICFIFRLDSLSPVSRRTRERKGRERKGKRTRDKMRKEGKADCY